MKILKYLFFLVVLALIGFSVFIATQKSNFKITNSTYIKLPRNVVYSYVNDYRNWEHWAAWKEDDLSLKFNYAEKTIGKGASYYWSGRKGSGKLTTTDIVENKKIAINVDNNGDIFKDIIAFKDTLSGTKITWQSEGNVNFFTKISAIFSGGVNKHFNEMFNRSLNNLNAVLTYESNNFSVKVNGMVTIPARFFVKSTYVCKLSETQSNINKGVSKIKFFFKNNNVKMNGKPFVIKEFQNADTTRFSVYGPLKEQIFVSEGSDLTTGFMEEFTALKVTLKGDYSHIPAARTKAISEFNNQQLRPSATILPMEVYFTTVEERKEQSKWITFIQIPIYKKPIVIPKKYKPRPKAIEKVEDAVISEPKNTEPSKEEF